MRSNAGDPGASSAEVVRALEHLGWRVARMRGSHIVMTKPGEVTTRSIPDHDLVARRTLRALITKAGLTVERFLEAAGGW